MNTDLPGASPVDQPVGRPVPKRAKLPSPAGQRALLNIASGRGSTWSLRSMSDHGGHKSTMLALRRAGLVLFDETLTPAGLEMVARLKTPNAELTRR